MLHFYHAIVMQRNVLRRPFCAFVLVFRHEEWLVGDDLLYLKLWAKLTPFDIRYFARSASAVIPGEKFN